MAKGKGRAAFRAKAVLAVAEGKSVAAAARAAKVTENTVRAALDRFRRGGPDALLDHKAAGKPPSLPVSVPRELLSFRRAPRAGRPPRVRIRIGHWVRDCIALGLFRRGECLPDRAWFARRFHTTQSAVQAAFATLRDEGFVRAERGRGTFVPKALPFDGRFLLLTLSSEGLDLALEAAARRQETQCHGIRWDVERSIGTDNAGYLPLLDRIASQRYAGVFIRSAFPQNGVSGRARFASIDHVPILCMGAEKIDLGSHARKIASAERNIPEAIFKACAAAGCRRPFVLDAFGPHVVPEEVEDEKEARVRRAAASAGIEIGPYAYQCVPRFRPVQFRRMLATALAAIGEGGIDSAISLEDNLTEALCEALAKRFDATAVGGPPAPRHGIRVFSAGSFPITQRPCLPVEWHGTDWDATLDRFVGWCAAVHGGASPDEAPVALVVR